jgi:hypothetical protein
MEVLLFLFPESAAAKAVGQAYIMIVVIIEASYYDEHHYCQVAPAR